MNESFNQGLILFFAFKKVKVSKKEKVA